MATPATDTKQAQPRSVRGNTAFANYQAARVQAMEAFVRHRRIQSLWRALTAATDALLAPSVGAGDGLTLIAVGGYGRRELFPYSDVDVLILAPQALSAKQERMVVGTLQRLWDAQVPVSHAIRSVADTVALAQQDATVCAALIDARYIVGDRKPYLALKRALRSEVFGYQPRRFVEAKLAERDARHTRFGASRFMLQPNVKEGKGGLRDLQTLNWLVRYCYGSPRVQDVIRDDMLSPAEWKHYRQAYLFFATIRAMLHIQRGRADERLSFDVQPAVAQALGFRGKTPEQRAERLMLRYFQYARAVGNMTRILCASLEEQQLRAQPALFVQENAARQLAHYLRMEHGRLQFTEDADLLAQPHQIIGLFVQMQEQGIDMHPRAQLQLARMLPKVGRMLPLDGESNHLFMRLLLASKSPEATLRRMNDMGVLGALIPEFGRLSGMMQYDGYHTYTVDEHILVALGNLRHLQAGLWKDTMPLSTALARETPDPAVLYVAMLCHDIAKGRGGGHAESGAELAKLVAQRLGLTPQQISLVSWVVRHHALLSDTAFKRDLDDPKTIDDFVALVQSPERLRLLLLVTVADIRAVGPTVYNGWKGALMRTLYHRAMVGMGVGVSPMAVQEVPAALLTQWTRQPAHPAIRITHDSFHAVSTIAIVITTVPRLLTALTGVLASLGASIVSARIRPLMETEAEGASYAEFQVQNAHGENFADDAKRLQRLEALIAQALADPDALTRSLAVRKRVGPTSDAPVRSGVFIDNRVSATASVIEINARDRIGLLHGLLQAIDACGLQVMTAHINTYGQLAVDVLYVKDAYGHKITHHAKMAQVKEALAVAIGLQPEGA